MKMNKWVLLALILSSFTFNAAYSQTDFVGAGEYNTDKVIQADRDTNQDHVINTRVANSTYIADQSHQKALDTAQSKATAHNAQRIDQNSQQVQRNSQDVKQIRKELKQIGNNAAAQASLHFNGNRDSWALSTGTAGDGAAMAAGIQKQVSDHVAVTVQASTSFDSGYMVGAGIHGDF